MDVQRPLAPRLSSHRSWPCPFRLERIGILPNLTLIEREVDDTSARTQPSVNARIIDLVPGAWDAEQTAEIVQDGCKLEALPYFAALGDELVIVVDHNKPGVLLLICEAHLSYR